MVREALTQGALRAMSPADAAALFLARRAEGLTASEEVLLADWLAADPAHAQAFEGADRAWAAFAEAEGDEILDAMRAHALAQRSHVWLSWPRAAAAAAVLFVVFGAAALIVPRLESPAPPRTVRPAAGAVLQYASFHGQVKDIVLPDGSTMTLDADSAAIARFGGKARSVELVRGRAFFAVAHDTARPFAVTAADRRVVAVGTRFDVNLSAGALTVTLLEGRVTVGPLDPKAATVTLDPGQQVLVRNGDQTVRTLGGQPGVAPAWSRGLMDFDDEPLSEAVAEVNRYAADQIVIRDPRVAALRVSGQFRAGEAERFARTVAEIHPVRVVRRDKVIELVPAG